MSQRKRRDSRKKRREAEARRAERLRRRGVEFTIGEDGTVHPTTIPLNPEVADALKKMEADYIAKTGRPIPPGMTMAQVFEELTGENPGETYVPQLMRIMWDVRIDPAKIYATWKSDGLMPTAENMDLIDPDVLAEFDGYMDDFDAAVDEGMNPFAGSVLEAEWDREGEDRLAAVAETGQLPARATERLAIPVPFSKEEWSGRTVSDITADDRFVQYFSDSINEIHASGRDRGYIDMFTMITHIERFPEFDRSSYGKFLDEARSQALSARKLEKALEIVLGVSGPNAALPTAVSAFEFLSVVGQFADFMRDRLRAGPRVEELIQNVQALAMLAFFVAINTEFGFTDGDSWSLPTPT